MGSKRNTVIKRAIYIFIIVLLAIPVVQQVVGFAYVIPLNGAIKLAEPPILTDSTWFSGKYQTQAEEFVKDNFGFRSEFVRLNNQLDYWFFGVINANSILIGKEGYLFDLNYINEYLGRYYIGKDEINSKVTKLKIVSDSLEARGIDIIFLLAAGKASYFPEFFPDSLANVKKTISNYDDFARAFDSLGIKHIDFNKWFVEMKDTTSYQLFTKGGIHWSKYSEYLVGDSIINYVEKLRNLRLPRFLVEKIDVSILPKYRDNDIGESMNLLFPHSTFPMAYPRLSLSNENADLNVKAMVVADSYYWELYNEGLSRDVFDMGQFWYYSKEIYSQEPGWTILPVEETDIRYQVEQNDIVFILQTEATINWFAFGFVDELYDLYMDKDYQPNLELVKKHEINLIISKINLDKNWLATIIKKAKEKGISTEEMILRDANYVYESRKK